MEIDYKIRELFQECYLPFGRIVLDSGVLSRKLPEVINKLKASKVSEYKEILCEFARDSWVDKTVNVDLPDFKQYPVPIRYGYATHVRTLMNKNETVGRDSAIEVAIKIAVTIANLDEILIRGEKRGWEPTTEHKNHPIRKHEKYVLAKSKKKMSYFGVKPFDALVFIRRKGLATDKEPISVHTQTHEGASNWGTRSTQFNTSFRYQAGNIEMEAEVE